MSTDTIKLYNVLVDQGIDREVAREAIDPLVTKDEAFKILATKDDLRKQTMWVAGMLVGQIAINAGLMALLFNLYG